MPQTQRFFSGATDMDALVDLIADQLILSDAWGTADATLVAGAHPAKRALQHLTDTNFYVTLDRNLVTSVGGWNANEIRVQVSTGFNAATHAPSGTIQVTGIPTESAINSNPTANNKLGSHWTWIDASGFTVLSTWAGSAFNDYTVLFTLERNSAKEYADGFSNFFVASLASANPIIGNNSGQGLYYGNRSVSFGQDFQRCIIGRPFSFQEYSADSNSLEKFFGAYRSPGNSKVYFEFPYFSNNQLPLQRSPIAQTQRFFWVQPPGGGLADGDLVTYVQGASTLTFLVKLLQSPDSTNYAPWAIRQA
jgi:hypothetical protein